MSSIPNPIHKSEQYSVKSALAEVIFNQDMPTSHSSRLFQQLLDVEGMMKYVNKHADIDGLIAHRNTRRIKACTLNLAQGPGRRFKPLDGKCWLDPPEEVTDHPVPATHIQDRRPHGKVFGKDGREHASSSPMHRPPVKQLYRPKGGVRFSGSRNRQYKCLD